MWGGGEFNTVTESYDRVCEGFIESTIEIINKIIEAIKNFFIKIGETIKGFFSKDKQTEHEENVEIIEEFQKTGTVSKSASTGAIGVNNKNDKPASKPAAIGTTSTNKPTSTPKPSVSSSKSVADERPFDFSVSTVLKFDKRNMTNYRYIYREFMRPVTFVRYLSRDVDNIMSKDSKKITDQQIKSEFSDSKLESTIIDTFNGVYDNMFKNSDNFNDFFKALSAHNYDCFYDSPQELKLTKEMINFISGEIDTHYMGGKATADAAMGRINRSLDEIKKKVNKVAKRNTHSRKVTILKNYISKISTFCTTMVSTSVKKYIRIINVYTDLERKYTRYIVQNYSLTKSRAEIYKNYSKHRTNESVEYDFDFS